MRFVLIGLVLFMPACRDSGRDTRTFHVQNLSALEAERLIMPHLSADEGTLAMRGNVLTVSATRATLDEVGRMIAQHDIPAANVRLTFQIIRANGAARTDSSIAEIEAELRRLFRFEGYQLVAQGLTTATPGSMIQLRLDGQGGPYEIVGELRQVSGDSTVGATLSVALSAAGRGNLLGSQLTVGIGRTVVLGGQVGGTSGAIILAVRPELVR